MSSSEVFTQRGDLRGMLALAFARSSALDFRLAPGSITAASWRVVIA